MLCNIKRFLSGATVFLILCFSVNAEKIVFSANKMTGQAGNSNSTTSLSGNAYIKTQSMEIQADEVELSGDDYRYIKASGNVSGKNLDANMEFTCDSLEFDRTTKIAELKGNVNLTDVDNDVKAEAQIIIYNQDTEVAVLQIKINLKQKDNVCSGSYAVYYKKTQFLELSGNATVKQKDDLFRAQYITLNMDTQDITLDGNVKGKVTETKEVKEAGEAEEGADGTENAEETAGTSDSDGEVIEKSSEKSSVSGEGSNV